MGSSESTPSRPPSRPPRLLLQVVGDDDPRVCTGARLLRFGRAVRVAEPDRLRPPPVRLDPYAPRPLSPADRTSARQGGVLAVDCSWNRLSERGGFPGERRRTRGPPTSRRLPFLLAANPQHYGRLGELNTVEALSAALFVLGYPRAAGELLEGFRGASAFIEINREVLERCARARTSDEILAVERDRYGGGPSTTTSP